MTSTDDGTRAPMTVHGFARLVEGLRVAAREVSGALAEDPSLLAEVPDELLESFTLALHDAADATTAAATVVTGRLERQVGSVRGKLVAGRYPSTSRFLQAEARGLLITLVVVLVLFALLVGATILLLVLTGGGGSHRTS